jgi:hypothetical protein
MIVSLIASLFAAPPDQAAETRFENSVRPVLVDRCVKCHGPTKQNGGLRLDSRAGALKGGDSGPAFIVGKPDDSLVVKAVRRHPDVSAMPPTGPLPEKDVAAIQDWIRHGAVWPEKTPSSVGLGDVAAIDAAAKSHWAFQPVADPVPPKFESGWSFTPIDQFLLQQIKAANLEPSADADRLTLIRRATIDLIGLPPTQQECEDFAKDPDPTPLAFNRVVDRLLASPRYGERWGRHWLDVARYADTKGYVFQEERRYPFSYTYRDWVVSSFNEDLPYDRFVSHQIAGDKTAGAETKHLAAMGYLTVGRRFLQDIQEITDDRIDVVTRGLLGLTVSCARCHDHKYDPLSMQDYYGLYGVFASSEEPKELPLLGGSVGASQRADFDKKMAERVGALDKYLNEQHATVQKRLIDDAGKLLRMSLSSPPGKLAEAAKKEGVSPGAARKWSERWNQRVAEAKKNHDPALAVWAAVYEVADRDFPTKASTAMTRLKANAKSPLAAELRPLLEKPLKSRADLAAVYEKFVREAAFKPNAAKAHPSLFGEAGAFQIPRAEVQQFLDRKQREKTKELERGIEELKVKHPGAEARAMVMVDRPNPVEPRVFLRGNPGRPGPATTRAVPAVLTNGKRVPFKEGSGRRELAAAIVDPKNPLTARVLVNRAWQWRFGKGLVESPSDFGLRSPPPSHPELLDHMARRFVEDGWSVKRLHRQMLGSHVYQISSSPSQAQAARDVDNRLLTRFPRLRLEWEILRDSMLAASGSLDGSMGGRPTPLFAEPMNVRRTMYGFIDRQNLDGAFRTFDFATPDATSPQRFVTTVPQQGLFLLNSKFASTNAERLAGRTEESADPRRRIESLFQAAYSRQPSSDETDRALAYLAAQEDWKSDPKRAWTRLAQALLLSNEFTFVD